MRDWSSYEGRLVQGWQLETFLGTRDAKAFFIARLNGGGEPRLMEVAAQDSEQLLSSWKRARELTKISLLRIYAAGQDDIDGDTVAFAVLDLPDDDLGEIIAKGPLDPEEARAIFSTVAGALAALHKRGLHHGAVTPSNIFVVNDEVRLSVDSIWQSGRLGEESDLRHFGVTLVCALTGRTDAAAGDDPAMLDAVARLGPPFYDIAVGCLRGSPDRRWTAQRIVDALSGRWAVPSVAPAAAAGETSAAAQMAPAATAETRKEAARQNFARWLSGPQWPITGTAAIVALILIVYLFVHGPRPHRASAPNSPPVHAAAVPPPAITAEPREAMPAPAPSRTAADSGAAARALPHSRHGNWAVIAATYSSFAAAQKRADRIRKQAPRLEPRVFPSEGQGKHYFVVLGSGLSQNDAERLRRNARALGAPRDTYVTKLNG